MRLMTWNLHIGRDAQWRPTFPQMIELMRAEQPDFIALQEVDCWARRTRWGNQPGQIGQALGMNWEFHATVPLFPLVGGGFGNAIVTRYPILACHRHRLPFRREPRGVIETIIEAEGRKIAIFATHFGLNQEERVRQAQRVVEIIAGRPNCVLMGDLNERPDGPAYQVLMEAGLTDSARALSAEANSFPAHLPDRRIDYILLGPSLRASRCWVAEYGGSDHRAVVGEC